MQAAEAAGSGSDPGVLSACDPQTLKRAIDGGMNVNRMDDAGLLLWHDAALCEAGVNGSQLAIVRTLLRGGLNVA